MEMENLDRFNINEYFNKLKKLLCKLGYEDKVININVAINLYQIYGEGFSEETFAKEVLGVSFGPYRTAKITNGNIRILKIIIFSFDNILQYFSMFVKKNFSTNIDINDSLLPFTAILYDNRKTWYIDIFNQNIAGA